MSLQSMLRRALAFTHLPKSVLPSGLHGRRPYASIAAAAAEEPNPDGNNKVRGRRRSKKELHAVVETFVNEYKAMNAGNFPPIKYTNKQVGGCYYRIRGILQELQYAAKMSPSGGGVEHSLGREGARGSESLTDVVGVSARTVSVEDDVNLGVVSDGSFEAKEESMTSSSVEILSEEVITPGRGSDLDVTQSNIGKVNAAESSYIDPDIVGNDMEEHTNNQSVSMAPGHEILQGGFEVISHSRDKSHDKPEEAQADLHDDVSKVKHLQIGDNNTASLSSDYMEDVTKPDLEECKMKQHEEIPKADLLDSITAEKHVPPEADKVSKDLPGRPAADAEPTKTTTLWGAMKSLADGIISIFRNQ
ncbi:hypothetical protein ACLB2K_050375 [Fragaria x ananassa]